MNLLKFSMISGVLCNIIVPRILLYRISIIPEKIMPGGFEEYLVRKAALAALRLANSELTFFYF